MENQIAMIGNTQSLDLGSLAKNKFIPSFNIGYPTSKSVKKGIAKSGEFVLTGQTSLGSSTEVIILDVRRHAALMTDKGAIQGEVFHFARQGDVKNNAEYQSFLEQGKNLPKGIKKMENAADLFLYIPSQQTFGVFFMKGALCKLIPSVTKAGEQGRLLKLTTEFKEWPEKQLEWWEVIPTQLDRALKGSPLPNADIEIPIDQYLKIAELWNNPEKGVVLDEDGAPERDR